MKHKVDGNICFQNQRVEAENEGKREDSNMSYISALA